MITEHALPEDLAAIRSVFDVDDAAPALGWDQVCAFEAEHAVVLPEPYRTFVAEITNGSFVGPPEYGLVGLGAQPTDGTRAEERNLAAPFPLTEAWLWDADPHPAPDLEQQLHRVFNHGSIFLGTEGCGMDWHLIVSGPHRGHIWLITGEGATPFGAEFGFTTGEPGFAGWIRHWAAGLSWFDDE